MSRYTAPNRPESERDTVLPITGVVNIGRFARVGVNFAAFLDKVRLEKDANCTRSLSLSGAIFADEDPKTDVLAPASLSMNNLTHGFSTPLSTTLFQAYYGDIHHESTSFWVADAFTNAFQCNEISTSWGDTSWSVSWNQAVAPGRSSGTNYAYIIIHDYFTPKHPNGDTGLIANVLFEVNEMDYTAPNQRTLVSVTGPGAISQNPIGVIPFSGKKSCDVSYMGIDCY
ncbi:MAG TPA: hypothetical protein VG944_00570 [Fimbriimonas sp.]|nr:hypothetical protein [Fimbriimonas sp.]